MTFRVGGDISRKKAHAAATVAVSKVDQLVERHNETIEEVARTRKGLEATQTLLNQRCDGAIRLIEGCETRTRATAHELSRIEKLVLSVRENLLEDTRRRDAELAHRQDRFEQMTFCQRVRWLLTGEQR